MILGLTNGVFDGCHEGHQFFLQECMSRCDKLIVLVNQMWWTRLHKGEDRPIHSDRQRMLAVRWLLRAWDEVHLWDGSNLDGIIERYAPNHVFRGWDQEADVPEELMIRILRHGNFSTTSLIEKRRA